VLFTLSALGLFVAVGWLAFVLRARHRVSRSHDWYLLLGEDGLLIAEGARQTHVPWADVLDVRIDEEHLRVVIERADGRELALDPRYRGQGVYDLAETVRAARVNFAGERAAKADGRPYNGGKLPVEERDGEL
jgi:hypothetical protein